MILAPPRTLIADAAYTTEQVSASQAATGDLGGLLIHCISVASGTGGLTLSVEVESPAGSGQWVVLLQPQNPTIEVSSYVTPVFWGIPHLASLKAVQVLPIGLGDVWRVRVLVADASSYTYSVEWAPVTAPFADYDTGAGVVRVPIQGLVLPGAGGPVPVSSSNPVPIAVVGLPYTDRSLAITLGGTAEPLMAANAVREAVIVVNPMENMETIWINPFGGTAAVSGLGSIPIFAGGSWEPYRAPRGAISVLAPTSGTNITAGEA